MAQTSDIRAFEYDIREVGAQYIFPAPNNSRKVLGGASRTFPTLFSSPLCAFLDKIFLIGTNDLAKAKSYALLPASLPVTALRRYPDFPPLIYS